MQSAEARLLLSASQCSAVHMYLTCDVVDPSQGLHIRARQWLDCTDVFVLFIFGSQFGVNFVPSL